MPVDPSGLLDAISNVVSQIPTGLLVAVFLVGPTAIWLIARFANPSEPAKRVKTVPENMLWVCASCRSINDDRAARCYRCHGSRADESMPGVGIAVGPGLPAGGQTAYSWVGAEVTGAARPTGDGFEPEETVVPAKPTSTFEPLALEPLALEPLALEPLNREPKAKVPRRASTSGAAGRRGRRKTE
jgi:hypothetical protein